MKKKKTLLILCCVLIVLCLGSLIIKGIDKKKEDIQVLESTVLSFDVDDVNSLSWSYEDESFNLVKEDNIWMKEDDADFPVNQETVSNLLEQICAYQSAFMISGTDHFKDYGLSNPTCSIQIVTTDNQFELTLGGYSTMDEERYFSIGDGNAYLAKTDVLDSFCITDSELLQRDVIPDLSSINTISLTGDATMNIEYKEEAGLCYNDSYVYYMKNGSNYQYLGSDRVEEFLNNISGISLEPYVTYTADKDDLSEYALDEPSLKISISYNIANEDGDLEKAESPLQLLFGHTDEDSYYLRINDGQVIYEIDQETYELFSQLTYENLRPLEVLLLNGADVVKYEFKMDNSTYSIDVTTDEDELNTYTYEDEEVTFDDVYYAIGELEYTDFVETLDSSKLEMTMTVSFENGDEQVVRFYQYDADNCILSVNGKATGLVSRTQTVDLKEAVTALVLGSVEEETEE